MLVLYSGYFRIIAFILINILSGTPEIALGVMVIAAAPGGVTSNILTKFADGDVALSVCLTAALVVSLSKYFYSSIDSI